MLNNYGELFEDISLENYNTYGIKTKTKYLIKPKDITKLVELIKYLNNNKIKYFILGKGSNVILPDNPFNGVIINLDNLNDIKIDNNIVKVSCGINLATLVNITVNNNLAGLETFGTIPGTLGGALVGNASTIKDKSLYDYLIDLKVIRNNELITLKKEDITYSYRYTSFIDSNDILVEAIFKLDKGVKEELLQIIKEDRLKRNEKQPLEYKNAGSVFKNPPGVSAGKLIDDCNLKGMHINDAYVSLKHANFIINKGNATSKDIKDLINLIKDTVYNKYKIKLELEQRIIEWE